MQAVLNAALPIFALIATGYGFGRAGFFSREGVDALNRFAIYLALPALIFVVMSRVKPAEIGQGGFAAAMSGGIAVAFGLGFLFCRLRGRPTADAALEGLDAGYANVGFMGIPLCLLLFGPDGLAPTVIAMLLTACVLFLGSIVVIEAALAREASPLATARKVTGALLRNPLFLAPAAGLAVGLGGTGLPGPVARYAELLGGAASPVALICIGLVLAEERFGMRDAGPIAILTGLKLVVQPAATAALVYWLLPVPPLAAKIAVLLSALPIGTGPFTIAKLYGLDAGVTSGAILLSHLLSVLTVSTLVALLA